MEVWVLNIGLLPITSNVASVEIPLVMEPLIPPSGSMNGGYVVTIPGQGLPFLPESTFKVMMCGKKAHVLAHSHQYIEIVAPACPNEGVDQVTLIFKEFTMQSPFVYELPQQGEETIIISQIVPESSSPVKKSHLEITGDKFGTDASAVEVWLISREEEGKDYPMKILEITETFLKVGLSGGLPGEYEVEVRKEGKVSKPQTAGATTFKYEIRIDSINVLEGSPHGGTKLIIQGKNFSPEESENLVFIGSKPNTFCEISEFSETQITCITPPKP